MRVPVPHHCGGVILGGIIDHDDFMDAASFPSDGGQAGIQQCARVVADNQYRNLHKTQAITYHPADAAGRRCLAPSVVLVYRGPLEWKLFSGKSNAERVGS